MLTNVFILAPFESGPDSITSQVERAHMRAVVLAVSDRDHWPQGFMFWLGEEQGLLVADN
jgi:hypothetical protein